MPELPEVEVTRLGLLPHLAGAQIDACRVHCYALRWPVPKSLSKTLKGARLQTIERRAKYLLFNFDSCALLVHLGMSGSLRLSPYAEPRRKHDHIELEFGQHLLRYHDPRRFGSWQLLDYSDASSHVLLRHLGVEPLSDDFTAEYLFAKSRQRRVPIKTFLMNQQIVVGVGNIYANEGLFIAGIDPRKSAQAVSLESYTLLVSCLKTILAKAIQVGGTTLRDFMSGDGQPGYFQQELLAYGRGGQACKRCAATMQQLRIGQRATVFCAQCQT